MNVKYPALNQSDTPLYNNVVVIKDYYQRTRPELFQQPEWPESLVEAVVQSMQSAKITSTTTDDFRTRLANRDAAEEALRAQHRAVQSDPNTPLQRNGQPLPRNWIDPDAADAQWQMQQLQQQIQAAQQAAQQAQQAARGW